MFGKKYLLSAVLACLPLVTHAETVYTFDSTLAIEHTASDLLITGVLVNDTVSTTVTLPWISGVIYDRCERLFNLVLSQPAIYKLTVVTDMKTAGGAPGQPPSQYLAFIRCRAELKS